MAGRAFRLGWAALAGALVLALPPVAGAGVPVPPPRPAPEASAAAEPADRSPAPPPAPAPRPRPAAEPAPETASTGTPPPAAPGQIWKRPPPDAATAAAIRERIERTGRLGPCNDPRLEGAMLPAIQHAEQVCGIVAPIRLSRAAGVRLTPPATLECRTARALADWIERVAIPETAGRLGSPLAELRTMGTYVCRNRNHREGARLSEHGFGRAVDIGALGLADGRRVSVEADWGRGKRGETLAAVHAGACGPFRTVLGPEADRYHQNHLHFDLARRPGRPYCR